MPRRVVPSRDLPPERRRFDAGRLCLNFAFTGGEGARAGFEQLHEPADLAAWLSRCELAVTVDVDPADLVAARGLRESIWQVADQVANGRGPDPAQVETINRFAAQPPLAPQLTAVGGTPGWARPPRCSGALATIARDAVRLLGSADVARLRACESADCPLIFFDTSRPGTRRWCSMGRCGNRAKVRALRERRRLDATVS